MIIALLGGESSGKSTLAEALIGALSPVINAPVLLAPEYLRQWCEAHGRAPLEHEQASIALTQVEQIEQSARIGDGPAPVVIADTTPLMVAAYSELYFGDDSLWNEALAFQRTCDMTLLMGLDLPWVADGLFRDSPAIRQATDDMLRRKLSDAGLTFQTVYGKGDDRLRHALRLIAPHLRRHYPDADPVVVTDSALIEGRGQWSCEACSDPDCEHRLFTRLMAERADRTI